MVQFN